MDIDEIRKLQASEQKKELIVLRKNFEQEREVLKQKIRSLESLKAEKESIAGGLATSEKRETLAEVSLIAGSIKNIKNEILGRNRELDFLDKALTQTEKLLRASEEQSVMEEKILDTILIRLMREKEQRDRKQEQRNREGLENLAGRADNRDLEETVGDEGVKTSGKEADTDRLYMMRGDLREEIANKQYIPAGSAIGAIIEHSEKTYAQRISQELQSVRNTYIAHVPGQDSDYMSKRQQEEEVQRNISEARRVLEEHSEFIREGLGDRKRNLYER